MLFLQFAGEQYGELYSYWSCAYVACITMGRQMIWDSFELDVWEEETGLSFFSSPFSLLPAVHQLPGIKKKKVASYICWKYEKHGHKLHTQRFFIFLFYCFSGKAVNWTGKVLKASTSSQCVSGWPWAFCSPLENHKCKRFPATAFIMVLVAEHGFL